MIDSCNRREFLRNSAVSLAALAMGIWPRQSQGRDASGGKPNLVFILIDDLGWKDVGCYGSEFYETPHIDALAAQGLRFTQAYASPVCSPARASFLTGKSPARVHMTDWLPGWQARRGGPKPNEEFTVPKLASKLDSSEITVAEAMRRGGYVTACFGKWHVGGKPDAYGFDVVGTAQRDPNDPKGIDQLTRMACDFMKGNRAKPFFLFLSHDAVHTPVEARSDLVEKYKQKRPGQHQKNVEYAAMVEHMDAGVGAVLHAIDELGLSDSTVVFFVGDNGGFHGYTSQYPLRNAKGTLYEGGTRVPAIARLPRGGKRGVCHTPVVLPDFFPTFLELAGLAPMPQQHMDGVSIVPLLTGSGDLPERSLFWHYPHYHRGKPGGAIRKGSHKLIEYFHLEKNTIELYDLAADLSESRDLSAEMPQVTEGLLQELHQWRMRVGAQMPTPNPNYKPKKKS